MSYPGDSRCSRTRDLETASLGCSPSKNGYDNDHYYHRDPDPTSVEFEDTFKELMEEALGSQHADRQIVIVIDNLDRVAPQSTRSTTACAIPADPAIANGATPKPGLGNHPVT